jgi:adenosylcobyric acid synthase
MKAPTLMVQGTASNVGKSLLVTALCRLFRQEGLRVLPFKSQNMALNSCVTPEGAEIGRAQAVQAEAAGVEPHVDMNPVLIKPEGDARSQIVVMGKPLDAMTAAEYHQHKPALRRLIVECLDRLRRRADLVIIEGAGSPAEINLKAQDIVNMFVAAAAEARVLLVGDIDRGGVFASLVGTLELLDPDERARIAGFIINKFRGDLGLLRPGLDLLTARTGIPVIGVLPFLDRLRLADEDSLSLEARHGRQRPGPEALDIAVVRLPRISNHDDFVPLEHEEGVVVRFVEHPRELDGADLVILPGSKSTVADLAWLRARGLADAITARARRLEAVLGICGGYQMMGRTIEDPAGIESPQAMTPGLDLLPVRTTFASPKITADVRARATTACFLTEALAPDHALRGYEIHMGRVTPLSPAPHLFAVSRRNGEACLDAEGAVSETGVAAGTLLHGLFENEGVRASLLGFLRRRRGLPPPPARPLPSRDEDYDRLAAALREHLDLGDLRRIAGLSAGGGPTAD